MDQNINMDSQSDVIGMYDSPIKVENKIITTEDLLEIIEKLNEEFSALTSLSYQEKIENANKKIEEQNYTTKDFSCSIRADFNFYDSTKINVDNYNSIVNFFNTRLHEIKSIYLWFNCSYSIKKENLPSIFVTKGINIIVYEDKMEFEFKLGTKDNRLYNIYDLIKQKVYNSKDRYDEIIKKKTSIINKIEFAVGMIPAIIITTLLAFIPFIRGIYSSSYILYPILTLILGFFLGNLVYDSKLKGLYFTISPKKNYVGYDAANNKRIYKDDIYDFLSKNEVIIGKNSNNINKREEISTLHEKYSKYIPMELLILGALSIIIVVIGKLI